MVVINKANTEVSLTSSSLASSFHDNITLTARPTAVAPGAGTPTGSVIFKLGQSTLATVPLTGGVATFSHKPTVLGSANYTAEYSGDANFNGASSARTTVLVHLPCADAFPGSSIESDRNGSTRGSTVGATGQSGEPIHTQTAAPLNSVWCYWTAPATGVVTFDTTGSQFDTALAIYTGNTVNALTPVVFNDNIGVGSVQSRVSFNATQGVTYRVAIDGAGAATGDYFLNWTQPEPAPPATYASVLPTARSIATGATATAFATIINAGTTTATRCRPFIPPIFPTNLSFQITNASNQPTGTLNTPQDIAPGAAQSFVFAVTPLVDMNGADLAVVFDCTNTPATSTVSGLNTLLLTSSSTPGPDLISVGATPSGDGTLNIPGANGVAAFAASAVNIGTAGTLTFSVDDNGKGLPLAATLCQSDPATAACVNPATPEPNGTLTMNANQVATFTIFVTGTDTVPFDPANNRLFLRFKTADGVTRGATSVAVRTQ